MQTEQCPECYVEAGQHHDQGCDHELCPYCGDELVSCGCDGQPPLDDRIPWTGERIGMAECREWGWYARLLPSVGWVACEQDDPLAVEDLGRFYREARWDRDTKRFVREGVVKPAILRVDCDTIECTEVAVIVNYGRFKLKVYLEGEGRLDDINLYLGSDSLDDARTALLDRMKDHQWCGWAFSDERIDEAMSQLDWLWKKDRKFKRLLREYSEP